MKKFKFLFVLTFLGIFSSPILNAEKGIAKIKEEKKDISEAKNQSSIELKLTSDLLAHSFSFLEGMDVIADLSLVNNNFNTIITDAPSCITSLDLSGYTIVAKDAKVLAPKTISLKKIKSYPALKVLKLSGNSITNKILKRLIPSLKNLQCLSLIECKKITDDSLIFIAHHLPHLTSLTLSGCTKISDDGLKALAPYTTKLKHLNLSWCDNISDDGLGTLISKTTDLEHVNLCGCTISDDGLKTISPYLAKLQYLNLSWCDDISDVGLATLSSQLINLKYLDLSMCEGITDAGLEKLTQRLINLEDLDINMSNNITDIGLTAVAKNLKKLQRLNVSSCKKITNRGLTNLARYQPNLTYLDLSKCERITFNCLAAETINGFKELKYLDISYRKDIDNNKLAFFIEDLPKLQSLILAHTNIDNHGLNDIAEDIDRLHYLDLNNCTQLSKRFQRDFYQDEIIELISSKQS